MPKNVGIGIVGIGFMGWIHYLALSRVVDARLAAIASRDPKKRSGDWTGIQGNFGPPGEPVNLSGVNAYADLDSLIDDPSVDLVDLCVPNGDHARMAIRALEAGKHVLVEKPIALTTADADAMVAASEKAGKVLMVGHVLPFFPEFAAARDAIASGRFGNLRAAHLKRVIARSDRPLDTLDAGPAVDLHVHDTHYIGLICGIPRAVRSVGVVDEGSVVQLSTQYLFDDPHLAVSAVSGALTHAGRSFTHGFEFYLDRATLSFEFASFAGQGHLAIPYTEILPDGTANQPPLSGAGDPVDAFVGELGLAVEGVLRGKAPPVLSAELARQALRLCHAEILSVKEGRAVEMSESF